MGIRIKKMIGYGLTDVKSRNGELIDPRINQNSFFLGYGENEYLKGKNHAEQLENYVKFLKEKEDNIKSAGGYSLGTDYVYLRNHLAEFSFYQAVQHDDEGGLPRVLVVIPISGLMSGWYRNDDSIDYAEAHLRKDPSMPVVKEMPFGHFPYSGYMDKDTGEMVKGEVYHFMNLKGQKGMDKKTLDYFAKESGYKNAEEATRQIVVNVPDDVRSLCEWGELFTKPEYVLQLKPLIYTYWS